VTCSFGASPARSSQPASHSADPSPPARSADKTIKTWSIPSLNTSVESYEALPSSVASFLPESIHVQPPTPSVDPGLPVHWSPEGASGDSAAVNLTPSRVIQASAPVFRARNLPFGSGLLSLPQSEETHLDLWALGELGGERVIKTFEGHTDKVKEFVWRIRGGEDLDRDDRSFQLITWGMDQSLRFWPIRESTLLVRLRPAIVMSKRTAKN
jgi:hypothetical protein